MSPRIDEGLRQQQGIQTPGRISLAHPVAPPTGEYRWVYLWHWPIRAMHWLAAAAIVVLVITGFLIGRPYFLPPVEVHSQFFIGWVRLLHSLAAGVFVATGIVRAYWLLAGNQYERLPALFPLRRRDWVNLLRMLRSYVLIQSERAPHYLGHNPLQQLLYTLIYAIALVMVVTGFALYGQSNPGGLIYTLFGWVAPLFGGIQIVRFVHHVLTWAFLIFVPVHVYVGLRTDVMERTGTISSMISGGRFVLTDRDYIDD